MNRALVAFLTGACMSFPAPYVCAQAAGDVRDARAAAGNEAEYYAVDYLVPPEGVRVEAGGIDFLDEDRLVVSTRRGQVWIVHDPLADDPAAARFQLFAEGLQEGLGLEVVDGDVYVLQRGELSRLHDDDGDGRCDRIELVSDDWGVSGNYHEFAFGLPRDHAGNFYIGLNVAFFTPKWWHGKSPVPYRGWILKIAPDGETTPVAMGARSPCGLGVNAAGDVFYTDNQGDWMPASPIYHVKPGSFFGHPASLEWSDAYRDAGLAASDTEPPGTARVPAAVWLPYDWSRSTGNFVHDDTDGAFGPFSEQLFVAELTNGKVLRVQLEQVRGEYQGAAFPFRGGIGSAVRVRFAPDGSLFVGMTDRGWGGLAPGDGIARVRWTGETPMEMQSVHLLDGGFEITFTRPVARGLALNADHVALSQYDYNWWWDYGSPEVNQCEVPVTSVQLSPDRTVLTLHAPGLRAGMVARLKLAGIEAEGAEGGVPLLHDEMNYTINQFPSGPLSTELVAKQAPVPPPRESWDEGWLQLAEGDVLDAWQGEGWTLGNVELDPDDARKLMVSPPPEEAGWQPVLVNSAADRPQDLVSRFTYGDVQVHAEFMIPGSGNSGIYLMGRYEVQIRDSSDVAELAHSDCGGLYEGWGDGNAWPGRAPDFQAFRGPGKWHAMDIWFSAPRFDEQGNKTRNAEFRRVMIDDKLMHEHVEVPNPTRAATFSNESPVGPLMLQGDHGPVAYRNVRVKSLEPDARAEDDEGWERIFNGQDLDGWKISDDGQWNVEDGMLVGRGPRSHIFSPRGDYADLEFRARVKIGHDSNSGMYFRVKYGPGWPAGYEAQVNANYGDPVKTGSFYNHDVIKTMLVDPDTWFTQHVTCKSTPFGPEVTIRVNGIVVSKFVDAENKHASGHVALQQHHDGSVVHYKDIEVRELR